MQLDSPFSSMGTDGALVQAQACTDSARLAAPTVLTVSVAVAESYRHTQPKSTGRFSSTLRNTTWKMLGRSCRSPMAPVMCCSSERRCICARERISDCWICVSM